MPLLVVGHITLALSEAAGRASFYAQISSMVLAVIIGRCVLRSRGAIGSIALLGAAGAMLAHIVVDGQGAFLLLFSAPVIYWASVSGRYDLTA